MATPKQPPKRSVLIAARLITAVVSLAGAEAMLWFGGYPRWWAMDAKWGGASPQYVCDATLGWRAKQGKLDLAWPGLAPGIVLTTNWSGGRRATSDIEPAPSDPRPKVMIFGDSYVQGYALPDAETMPWVVQQHHPELQVSNYATGDYSTYQAYLAIKNSVHGPASVYYLFNWFHEGRNAADPNWLRINKKMPEGCFYPYAELIDGQLREERSQGRLVWWLSHHLRTVAMVQDYMDIFESLRRVRNKRNLTQALLVKMDDAVHAQGGKFTVILSDLLPEDRKDYRKFLQSKGIAFLDYDRPELADKKLRLADGHPNAVLAQMFAQWMEPLQLLASR